MTSASSSTSGRRRCAILRPSSQRRCQRWRLSGQAWLRRRLRASACRPHGPRRATAQRFSVRRTPRCASWSQSSVQAWPASKPKPTPCSRSLCRPRRRSLAPRAGRPTTTPRRSWPASASACKPSPPSAMSCVLSWALPVPQQRPHRHMLASWRRRSGSSPARPPRLRLVATRPSAAPTRARARPRGCEKTRPSRPPLISVRPKRRSCPSRATRRTCWRSSSSSRRRWRARSRRAARPPRWPRPPSAATQRPRAPRAWRSCRRRCKACARRRTGRAPSCTPSARARASRGTRFRTSVSGGPPGRRRRGRSARPRSRS
mmetsp:Transcript_46510/g.122804  ORF Transcript_46510/g.122804 Transcript_46510/m.122804 type:complete len:317 (-) Transcript_46510:312-1262(-)